MLGARTIVRLPDGREGTVVYSGLDGEGIKWGRHEIPEGELEKHVCLPAIGVVSEHPGEKYPWFPDAMLRNPYPSADLPCVGQDYEVVEEP